MENQIIKRFGQRLGYDESEMKLLEDGGHRIRHVRQLAKAAALYSIEAEVVKSHHCNSGYEIGQKFILDIDGNFITKLCPKRMCVYLISQLTLPVAMINERLSEGLDPNDFHFMRYVRCPDAGVECLGYGEVTMKAHVIPRVKLS
jgi:uncharacterized repeat protein (TIGR04076 family)